MKPTNKLMKRLSLYLFLLLFTLQTPSWADDIRDFEIEGISIGDSLLDYFTEKDLKNAIEIYYYKNKVYMYYFLNYSKSQIYENLQISVEPKDKNLIIHAIQGHIFYQNNINDCYKKMDGVKKEINDIFDLNGTKDFGKHPIDKSGKSKYSRIFYDLKDSGYAEIICYDMSKKLEKKGRFDRFVISIGTKEFLNFLTYEAY